MPNTKSTGYHTLAILLSKKKVVELREIARVLGYEFKPGNLKKEKVEVLEYIMLTKPERIVESAFHYELKAWRDIIDGKMTVEESEIAGYPYELNRFGMVYVTETKVGGKTSWLHFQEDMAKLLRPLIDSELTRRETDGSLEVEKLALGLANVYGFTDPSTILSYFPDLEKHIGKKIDDRDLETVMQPLLCIMRPTEKDCKPLISPLVEFTCIDTDNMKDWKPKRFDLQEILDFGEMPYPKFRGRYADKLKKVLEKHTDREITTPEAMIRHFFLDKQRVTDEAGLPDLTGMKLDSFDKIKEAVSAILEFENGVPFWQFRGYSSEEAYRRENPQTLSRKNLFEGEISASLPGIGMSAGMSGIGKFNSTASQSEKKTGRNDPCPCGSGKKYKHCCGR